MILILIGYLLKETSFPRTLFIIFVVTNFVFLTIEKAIVHEVFNILREKGYNRTRVLIVGTNPVAQKFVKAAKETEKWGIDIVGFLSSDRSLVGSIFMDAPVLGTFDDIERVLHSNYIDEVIFAPSLEELKYVPKMFEVCEIEGTATRFISSFLNNMVSHVQADVKYGFPILTYSPYPNKEWQLFFKRVLDIVISGILLIPFGIFVLPIVSLLIKLTSPGPVFYKWEVMGANKRKFTGYKFRTMYVNADEIKKQLMDKNEMSGPVFKMKNDPRVTPIGRFLRKYSIDELPQLWSVFIGDMSLVGPRPPLQTEVEQFENWHRRKLSVKPGITCLWQVSGRNEINDFNEWVKMDLEYIDNWSLWLDIKILFKTIPAVLTGKGAR